MNILQIPRRFVAQDWGGTETVILETSKCLLKMGHNTSVLCPNILATTQEEYIDNIYVKRFPYFYPYFGISKEAKNLLDKRGGNIFSFALMRELRRSKSVDLFHLHTGKRLGGIVSYIAKKRSIPYVMSLHGGVYDVPEEEKRSWVSPTQGTIEWGKALGLWVGSRDVLKNAKAIICVGKEECARVQQNFPDKKVLFLPNGVDLQRFIPSKNSFREKYAIDNNKKVILQVGRITPQKNQLFSLKILRELLANDPNIHLVIIGYVNDELYYQEILQTVKKWQLCSNVTIIPGMNSADNNLVSAYNCCDVFLLPSVHEPFGIVILEAWACKKPVVASNVGGIPSFVSSRKNGVLCTTNDLTEFCTAILNLFIHKEYSQQVANNGYNEAVNHYSWEQITRQLLEVYQNVMEQK